jgi:transcriptional regulator with XRE-family HTH domain
MSILQERAKRENRARLCRLTKVAQKKGKTHAELAEEVGVGVNTLGQWARGMHIPNALVLDDLCRALNCKLEDIYPR